MKRNGFLGCFLAIALMLTGIPSPAAAAEAPDGYFPEDESAIQFPGVENRTVSPFNPSFFSVTGFAGGKVDLDHRVQYLNDETAYRTVKNEEEFLEALEDAAAGDVKVIEIAADLNLGWNALSDEAKEISTMIRNYQDPVTGWPMRANIITNPSIVENGISQLELSDIHGLTIFSRAGNTVKHAEWKLQGTCSDIIIRNLNFDEVWMFHDEKDGDNFAAGWSLLKLNGVKGVWIDHCSFSVAYDGNIDSENGASDMTVSWCSFGLPAETDPDHNSMLYKTVTYMEERFLQGLENDTVYARFRQEANGDLGKIMAYLAYHKGFNMNGSGEADFKDGEGKEDGNWRIHLTWAYSKISNIVQRFPLIRQGTVNAINCYLNDSGHKEAAAALGRSVETTAVSARAGASVGMDTCVFEGVDRIIDGTERNIRDANNKEWGDAFSNARNHTLIVNSKIKGAGENGGDYIGSSWDQNGENPFIGDPAKYWNDGYSTLGENQFKWFSRIENEHQYVRGILPDEPFTFSYESRLPYDYQVLPLTDVEETLDQYAGAYVLNEDPEFWLSTEYLPDTQVLTAKEKGISPDVEDLSLRLAENEKLEMAVGEMKQITAEVVPSNAGDKTITWKSSDPSVLEVKDSGLLVAGKPGTAVISVLAGKIVKTFSVDVYQPVSQIRINGLKDGDTIYLGTKDAPAESVLLTAEILPEDATYPQVTWYSDAPAQLKIDRNGVVTPLAERPTGATITCVTKDGHSQRIKVIVESGSASKNTYKPFLYGDTDGDGHIAVQDAILILKKSVKLVELDDAAMIAANVDDSTDQQGNPLVTVDDAIQILKYLVKLTDGFAAGK